MNLTAYTLLIKCLGFVRPVYLSFDIDSLDPAFAPGTGTPEIAGLTSIQVCFTCRSEMLKPALELRINSHHP